MVGSNELTLFLECREGDSQDRGARSCLLVPWCIFGLVVVVAIVVVWLEVWGRDFGGMKFGIRRRHVGQKDVQPLKRIVGVEC
jgi:hypothetical protein